MRNEKKKNILLIKVINYLISGDLLSRHKTMHYNHLKNVHDDLYENVFMTYLMIIKL